MLAVLSSSCAANNPSCFVRRFPFSRCRRLARSICLGLASPLSVCATDCAAGLLPRAALALRTRARAAPSLLPSRARASLPAADGHLALKKDLALARSRYGLSGFFSHLEPPHSRVTPPLAPQIRRPPVPQGSDAVDALHSLAIDSFEHNMATLLAW